MVHALSWKMTGARWRRRCGLPGSRVACPANRRVPSVAPSGLCAAGLGEILLTGCDCLTLWEETTLPGQNTVTMWQRLWEER